MLYFKNSELAEAQHVSLRTVFNWIEAAKQGKLDLTLHTEGNKTYVANTARNIATIERLVEDRKKYRNRRGLKVVTPKPEFYQLYTQHQIFDLTNSLDIYREIPYQYSYFDGGADYWDEYAQRLATEDTPNFLTSTDKLLSMNRSYFDSLLARYKRVNVVDIGAGNAMPVRWLLEYLISNGKLGRYIAIDTSPALLKIAKRNIHSWFASKVLFEGCEADINYDRFSSFLAEETIRKDAKDTVNLVLLLGGTLCNLRTPDKAFRIIHDSMNRNDLFLYAPILDTEATRQYFDISTNTKIPLAPQDRFMIDLLNIDESFYEVEMGFDEGERQRYIRIRLKVALSIEFKFDEGERYINLNKGDVILLWRHRHQGRLELLGQLERNGFDTLQASLTEDREYILTISRVGVSA